MIEESCQKLETIQSSRTEGALLSYLDAFVSLLAKQGYAESTFQRKSWLTGKFSQWFLQHNLKIEDLNEKVFDKFIEWKKIKGSVRRGDTATFVLFLQHLRGLGIIEPTPSGVEETSFDHIEHDFVKYLSRERGLSSATIVRYPLMVRLFLSNCPTTIPFKPELLTPSDITKFILSYAPTVKRSTAKLMMTSLRSFFYFLWLRGKISTNLAGFIPAVAGWRMQDIPKFLESKAVASLLSCLDQGTNVGQRDYTVLLILARLGLRAGEVTKMTLDDIDWESGEIIIRGKGPRTDRLPLPHDVGKALATYLQRGRPSCSSRRVFLRARAPYQGFSSSVAVCNIVQRALLRANLHPVNKGAHLLRHSLATYMLNQGVSLVEIGEILRHRLVNTTEIYAKVDFTALRLLAQPWPGGEA